MGSCQLVAVIKEGRVGAGSDGSLARERCLCSIMSLGVLGCFSGRARRKGVLEKDVEDEWRHRPAYEEGFIPETWQMRFGNANSDEAEVNQPLSTPLFPEVDQGDIWH